MNGCIFCQLKKDRVIEDTKYYHVIHDLFPVSHLHTLIIPKRHISSYFDLNPPELEELSTILIRQKNILLEQDTSITGFNIGINIGEDAGQTIFHCHVHLIPRRKGDVKDPRGGIRGVIPKMQKY